MAINEALYFLTGGMPGAFDFVVDPLYQNTSMIAFVRDTSPGTVETLIRTTEEYLEKNWHNLKRLSVSCTFTRQNQIIITLPQSTIY